MGVTINNESTTTESPHFRTDSSLSHGGLKYIYLCQILAIDSVVARMEAS